MAISETEVKAPLLPPNQNDNSAVENSTDLEASVSSPSLQLPQSADAATAVAVAAQFDAPNSEATVESLDYDPIFSLVHAKTTKVKSHRRLYGYTGLTLAKWTITILIGILVGLVAYVMESSQEFIVTRKKSLAQRTLENSMLVAFTGFAAISTILVIISSCMVLFWAPPAAGGGVTLVMAYLNGNDIPDFFRFSTLVTKIVGTICSISSGLLVGQEAPLVHIGAAIASTLTWMHGKFYIDEDSTSSRSCCSNRSLIFDFHNDKDRREFISAGAAAGLAAAFSAPIGGVLYSLEEASSFWSKKVMWRSLLCCTCATMLVALINEWNFSVSPVAFRRLQPAFALRDLPLFIITSACAGMLGAFVNIAHGKLERWRPSATRKFARLLEVCLMTLISVIFMFALPLMFGKCLPVPIDSLHDGTKDENYWYKFNCPSEGEVSYYNDLATLFFSLPRKSMKKLYETQGNEFPIRNLGIHTVSVLALFIAAYGIATPGGIFMPSMLTGASFGACMGKIFQAIFPKENIQPGLHAIVGSTAMLGGVFRASISLVVIMVEGTGGIDFILPIITAIVVSNWVAHHIYHTGAYEADLERLGGVYFLQSEPPHQLVALTASDIMSVNVISFSEVVSVREVVEVLRHSRHNGFPVLRNSSTESHSGIGKFVGLILRHQLLLLLEQKFFVEIESSSIVNSRNRRFSLYEKQIPKEMQILEHAMRVYHHYHHPHRRYLSSKPEALEEAGIYDFLDSISTTTTSTAAAAATTVQSAENINVKKTKSVALDLRPFMNRAPLTVRRECSAQRVYIIFRTLGLRHLCVTDSHNRVIGIITRKDIAMAQNQSSTRKAFQRWDSDTRSFAETSEKQHIQNNATKLFNLP